MKWCMRYIVVLISFLLVSCSSVKEIVGVKYKTSLIHRDINTSANTFDEKSDWKLKPQEFGEKHYKTDTSWFFTVASHPAINQRVACRELNDSLRVRLSKHMIDYLAFTEDEEEEWVIYLREVLGPKFASFFSKARIRDTAWEYGSLGDEDTSQTFVFVCYALVEIPKESLKELLVRTGEHISKRYVDVVGIKSITQAWYNDYVDYHTQAF